MANQLIAAMVVIEIDPDKIDVSTAGGASALRKTVLDNLCNVRRVVAIMTEDEAQLMLTAHDAALRSFGGTVHRPPADYVPPTQD